MDDSKSIMAENIRYYLDLHGKKRDDLCRDLGLKYTTVSNWLQGVKYPRIDKIEMMAKYFGISKADLVEKRSSNPPTHSPPLSPADSDLLAAYHAAPPPIQDIVNTALAPYSVVKCKEA
jgi:transcriptional regulator with XRE-family HTH domain